MRPTLVLYVRQDAPPPRDPDSPVGPPACTFREGRAQAEATAAPSLQPRVQPTRGPRGTRPHGTHQGDRGTHRPSPRTSGPKPPPASSSGLRTLDGTAPQGPMKLKAWTTVQRQPSAFRFPGASRSPRCRPVSPARWGPGGLPPRRDHRLRLPRRPHKGGLAQSLGTPWTCSSGSWWSVLTSAVSPTQSGPRCCT
ncbi:MAG: hypothetical protein Ct9H300mP12_14610 [Acidimicrobiales bacterium]|nr:MAG: hypothetical protein Ct9H300mP12_14610 [Acidimicrobiales bacterium]